MRFSPRTRTSSAATFPSSTTAPPWKLRPPTWKATPPWVGATLGCTPRTAGEATKKKPSGKVVERPSGPVTVMSTAPAGCGGEVVLTKPSPRTATFTAGASP